MEKIFDIQQFQQFDNLELIARQIVEGFITGLHRSPFHGFSVEFAEHRLYNTGESTKHIDWKLYARTERLFVKRYEEETNLRCQIVIDTSSSMLFPLKGRLDSKLVFSIYSAAALIYLLRKQRDAVGLTLFADDVNLHTPSRLSSVHAKLLYAELANLLNSDKTELRRKTFAANALHQIAENIHKRSLVIIFSDMIDSQDNNELLSALQHLRYNKHEVVLFHVHDSKREKDFNFENRPYKFIDMETGESIKFNPNDVRDEYVEAVDDYYNQIKLKCGQYQVDLVEADINQEFKNVLLPYLLKRNKLY